MTKRYNTINEGKQDWHIPLNKNFNKIDNDVEIRDEEDAKPNYTPKNGAKFMATDTENIYIGDGNSWNKVSSSGKSPTFSSISSKETNGELNISEFSGVSLSKKVSNALKSSGIGEATLRIPSRDDGNPWNWGSSIEINSSSHDGITLYISDNAVIECNQSGYALTIDGDGSEKKSVSIEGGVWKAGGTSPDGWLQLKDIVDGIFKPNKVDFSNGGQTCVSIENHDSWSELNTFEGGHYQGNICFDFKPARVTGGDGTKSFSGTTISDCFIQAKDIGIRLRGGFHASELRRCNIFTNGDGATGMVWGHGGRGMIISGLKIESAGSPSDYTDTVGIRTTDKYNEGQFGPLVIGLFMWQMDGAKVERANQSDRVCVLEFGSEVDGLDPERDNYGSDFWIRDLGTDREFRFDLWEDVTETGGYIAKGGSGASHGTMLALTDIRNLSGTTGNYDGEIALDDGSNTSSRGMICVWDDTTGVWVDQSDGSHFS